MSTFWIHRQTGTVAVDDAVLKGVDVSAMPSNMQLMWWYGTKGEIKYNDRLGIREPVTNLAAFIHIFDSWMLVANTPQPSESGRTVPTITLAQAKAVKSELVWGLYYNKFEGLTPGTPAGDNTASVNASIDALVQSVNNALVTYNSNVATSTAALNTSLDSQHTGHTANIDISNSNFNALSNLRIDIPSGGGSANLPTLGNEGGIGVPSMPQAGAPPSVSAPPVQQGASAVAPTDPLAPTRDTHLNNVGAQTTVAGVAAYDITAGW